MHREQAEARTRRHGHAGAPGVQQARRRGRPGGVPKGLASPHVMLQAQPAEEAAGSQHASSPTTDTATRARGSHARPGCTQLRGPSRQVRVGPTAAAAEGRLSGPVIL